MNKILTLLFTLFLSSSTLYGAQLKFEPVYSVETTRREYPEPPNQITRTYIGLSALYGTNLLSGELELAQSTYSDSFPSDDQEFTSVVRRAMLGIRSYPLTHKYVGFFLRAGARAKQETLDIKESGESRTEEKPVYVDPYAGAGITIALASNVAINASATLVQNASSDADAEDRYDVQYTLSGSLRFGNR